MTADGKIPDVKLEVRAISPALRDDFLRFFDRDAFPDNPAWARCYCFFNHAPHDREDWEKRTAEHNRPASAALIDQGGLTGYLAFADGRVVGWCNANLRARYTTLDGDDAIDGARTGAIVCFVVAPAFRGKGVATRLLDAVCDGFARQGITMVEAYPRNEAPTQAANYHGPLAMFLKAGFRQVREDGGVVVVRRELGRATS